MSEYLIDCEGLLALLKEGNIALVDCRFELADAAAGRRAYQAGHIPGARFLDLEEDLAGQPDGGNGRHPLPQPGPLAGLFSRIGIDNNTRVVVYDDVTGPFAAHCWWLLRWLGNDNVKILDGGWRQWTALDMPVSTSAPSPSTRRQAFFVAHPRDELRADMTAVREAVRENAAGMTLDARQEERWRGEVEPIDPVKGRIPGAQNYPHGKSLREDGTLQPPNVLQQQFAALNPPAQAGTIHYCGSGITACHNIFALTVAGLPPGRLYAGSWSEWCAHADNPVETDADGA